MHVFGQWDKAWVLGEKETNPTQPVSGLVSKTILMWGKGANDCTTNKYQNLPYQNWSTDILDGLLQHYVRLIHSELN